MKNIYELESEYLEQYPNEENPFNWVKIVSISELVNFMRNRDGRKVGLITSTDKEIDDDGGQLVYL